MAKFVNAMFLVVMLFVGHSSTTAEGARKVLDDIGGKPDFCIAYPCCIKPPLCKPTPHDDAKAIAIDASPAPPTNSHHQ
ncbi:hypothetical protein P8452_54266 [Trifolium repens]|nr:hypothetical protein QL285_035773 [Trifolium repens]WJX70119.1 hypothetical protein P8452_54266 [Trifolium repens]